MRTLDRQRHPLEKILDALATTRADLQKITSREAVINCLSIPECELDPKLEAWLVLIGVDIKGFNRDRALYWERIKARNLRTTRGA
jgi:hypothetical protein